MPQTGRLGWLLLAVLLAPGFGRPVRGEIILTPGDLQRGLVTTYRDAARPTPAEVVCLEPTVALALKADEAPHPRLRTDGGSAAWRGYLDVRQAGAYRFSVRLRGRFRLKIGGKEVLAAESADRATLGEGPAVQLEAGVQPLVAEFTRLPGAARVELFWQAKHFRREPLPHDHVGHLPSQAGRRLAADTLVEHGRFLAEEAACAACHPPGDGAMARRLVTRTAPDLSQVGRRLHPGWIERWLADPHQLRPGAAMPMLFPAGEAGRAERHAVASYLASLGGPVQGSTQPANSEEAAARRTRGRRLFDRVGCVACHGPADGLAARGKDHEKPAFVFLRPPRVFPLLGLGSKTTPEQLAAYLGNPLAIDPSGRMPHLLLQADEALDLAHFLCRSRVDGLQPELPKEPSREQMLAAFRRVDDRADELEAFQRLPARQRWLDLGMRLVIDRGCNNCHTIAPDDKPFASVKADGLEDVAQPARQQAGCLAEAREKRGRAPDFGFTKEEREALRAFLREGLTGAGSPAPTHAARRDLQRFNCLACHSRDGEGGLPANVIEQLLRAENADHAEAVTPPPLTGVGHRLRTPWLRQVLVEAGRARPWMGLRMPQFGADNIGSLPEKLATVEGAEPDETIHQAPGDAVFLEAGRRLVGKDGFGCLSCHDLASKSGSGARGPDLALMNQRVRYDWYRRWLEQPQRMQPGTRMPTVFAGGKSLLDTVLDGKVDAQAEAIWAYLADSHKPKGPGRR
jgi:mono/diheme cytochrome c family protein